MKKLLLVLLCLPMIGFGQQTYIPDDNFEQALINLGYDNSENSRLNTNNQKHTNIFNINDLY